MIFLGALSSTGPLWAKAPAYTLAKVGFPVSLHNVTTLPNASGAADPHWPAVAEGEAEVSGQRISLVIREHRTEHPATRATLRTIAKERAHEGPRRHEVRFLDGTADGAPTAEQWLAIDTCEHVLVGRVFVALSDKVLELEAASTVAPGKRAAETALERISAVLHGVRVRRLDDTTLDPASTPPAACDVAVPAFEGSCRPPLEGNNEGRRESRVHPLPGDDDGDDGHRESRARALPGDTGKAGGAKSSRPLPSDENEKAGDRHREPRATFSERQR